MTYFSGHLHFNPLTPEAFWRKGVFWTFGCFLGWILAKLALMCSKMHLHFDSLAFLPLASRFTTLWLGHAQKSKFWDEIKVFGRESDLRLKAFRFLEFFFRLSFFSFTFLFAAVIDLLISLLAVKKLLRKRHRDGQILLWGFHSTFWAFLCISKAPCIRPITLIWASLGIDDAIFGQKLLRQK